MVEEYTRLILLVELLVKDNSLPELVSSLVEKCSCSAYQTYGVYDLVVFTSRDSLDCVLRSINNTVLPKRILKLPAKPAKEVSSNKG